MYFTSSKMYFTALGMYFTALRMYFTSWEDVPNVLGDVFYILKAVKNIPNAAFLYLKWLHPDGMQRLLQSQTGCNDRHVTMALHRVVVCHPPRSPVRDFVTLLIPAEAFPGIPVPPG